MATQSFKTPSGATVTIDQATQGVVSTADKTGANIVVPGQTYEAPGGGNTTAPVAKTAAPVAPIVNTGGGTPAPGTPPSQVAPTIATQSGAASSGGSGYKLDAKGNIVDASGSIIAGIDSSGGYSSLKNAQGQSPTGVDGNGNLIYGTANGNAASETANANALLNPPAPQTEDQIYQQYLGQSQGMIDALQSEFDASITNNEAAGAVSLQNMNSLFGTTGAVGSAAAISKDTVAANATTLAARATAVQGILTQLSSAAATEADTQEQNYETNLQTAATEQQNLMTQATTTIAGLAKNGVNYQQFSTNPAFKASFQKLTDMAGGDPNTVASLFALGTPAPNVVQTFMTGNTMNQVVQDPVTGQVHVISSDLGVAIPPNWQSTKIGTTGQFFQDPSNAGNTFTLSTDPYTGGITATGTGAGQQWADQYNAANNGGSSSTSTSTTTPPAGTGGGNYVTTFTNTLASATGTDPTAAAALMTQPLTQVVNTVGVQPIVQSIIAAEGGSVAGVQNNPGNVKFVGSAGQTDSGVKATDGGTFANYSTKEEGQAAIESLVQSAASGTNKNYGATPTMQSFLSKYANLSGAGSTAAAPGVTSQQYGLLASPSTNTALSSLGAAPFDPGPTSGNKTNAQALDNDAFQYLKIFLQTGQTPTQSNLLGMRSGTVSLLPQIASRAQQLYTAATGQGMPDQEILDANKSFLTGNNSLLNSLNVQEKTISANSDLLQANINASNINQNAPALNGIIDNIKNMLGDPNVSAYLAQNSTLSNELGSLLALKNASGTTVHDKLISADLISPDASAAQEAQVVNQLMKEAQNARTAIGASNAALYAQVDPLGLDPQNPMNAPGYSELTTAGATNNYNGTWTLNGKTITVNSDGTVTEQ